MPIFILTVTTRSLRCYIFCVSKCKQDDWPISFVTLRSIIFCCGWTPIMNMLLLKMFNHWSSILENLPNDTFFRSRMNVKIMCEFWPKLILTHYWFAVPIASSPNAERIRVFARKPTIRPTLQNWLTTESWDWSMNSLALAVVLLTPNTIPPQFSQVNLLTNAILIIFSIYYVGRRFLVCTALKMVQLSCIDMRCSLNLFFFNANLIESSPQSF